VTPTTRLPRSNARFSADRWHTLQARHRETTNDFVQRTYLSAQFVANFPHRVGMGIAPVVRDDKTCRIVSAVSSVQMRSVARACPARLTCIRGAGIPAPCKHPIRVGNTTFAFEKPQADSISGPRIACSKGRNAQLYRQESPATGRPAARPSMSAERCQATPGRLMLRPPLRRCRGIWDHRSCNNGYCVGCRSPSN
jgi:hypothetical protein